MIFRLLKLGVIYLSISILFSCQNREKTTDIKTDFLRLTEEDIKQIEKKSFWSQPAFWDTEELDKSFKTGSYKIIKNVELRINGDVKSYKAEEFKVIKRFKKLKEGEIINKEFYIFNANGNLIEEECDLYTFRIYPPTFKGKIIYKYDSSRLIQETYCDSGDTIQIIKYEFNDNIKRISKVTYSSSGQLWYKNINTYDESSNLLEEQTIDSLSHFHDNKTIHKYNFDSNGEKIEELICSDQGIWTLKKIYKYDDLGRLIESCIFYSSDSLKPNDKTTFKYDFNGNIIEKVSSNFDSYDLEQRFRYEQNRINEFMAFLHNDLIIKETNKYNSTNKLIEKITNPINDSTRLKFQALYKYDIKGHVVEESWSDLSGNFRKSNITILYKYDDKGNILEITLNDSEGLLISKKMFKYGNFDSMGNWLIRTFRIDNEYESITERAIEYY